MPKSHKLVFGASAKEQVAKLLQVHVSANFKSMAMAAVSLGISRQRLFSYMSGRALPRATIFDLMLSRWKLDLLGRTPPGGKARSNRAGVEEPSSAQLSLFDKPITLRSEELTVVIKRKGPGLVANVEISANVEIA